MSIRRCLVIAILCSSRFSYAFTSYECAGEATLLSEPVKIQKNEIADNVTLSALKTKLLINSIGCSEPTVREKFTAESPSVGFDYKVFLYRTEKSGLKKKDHIFFNVKWTCDKKCREKQWTQISETDLKFHPTER